MERHVIAFALLPCCLSLLAVSSSTAAVSQWTNDGGGIFETPSNWDTGAPGSADTAVFQRGSVSYSVQFDTDITTDKLRVGTNTVTFQPVAGVGNYTVANAAQTPLSDRAVVIGEAAGDVAVLNSSLPNFTMGGATLGDAVGSVGTLNVNAGTVTASLPNADTSIDVGGSGTGYINVLNGSSLSIHRFLNLGRNAGSSGNLAVNGGNVSLNFVGSLVVGGYGSGNVNIAGGGVLSDLSNLIIGGYAGAVGAVTVDGATSRINALGGEIDVGQLGSGSLSIKNGAQAASFSATVGNLPGSHGDLTVDGAGSLFSVAHSGPTLQIGRLGTGTMAVTNSAHVMNRESAIGQAGSGAGSVTIDGAGSLWASEDRLTVHGNGSLSVSNGGQVTCTAGLIGEPGSGWGDAGAVVISGQGSSWTTNSGPIIITGGLLAGSTATANLLVNSGGTVTSYNSGMSSVVSSFVSSRSSAIIDGAGSTWSTTNNFTDGGVLTVTSGGQVTVGGRLTITSPGTLQGNSMVVGNVKNGGVVSPGASPGILTINGNYTQDPTGILQIELASPTSFDRLPISGTATLAGTLKLSLLGSYTPAAGDSFDILDWQTESGTFSTLQLPALTAGNTWDTSQLYTTGTIAVVPEPSTLTLAAIGVGLCAVVLISRNKGIYRPHSRPRNIALNSEEAC
jgi:T5SS/PEP-CTERM-associated repeat protein